MIRQRPLCEQLHLTRPVVVGHSTGGYAVTAATAAGLLDASGICVIDGFVPAMPQPSGWTAPTS